MEGHPGTLGTATPVSPVSQEFPGGRLPALLGQNTLSFESEEGMRCLAVQGWQPLLVHQRNDLPRKSSGELAAEDAALPEVQGIQVADSCGPPTHCFYDSHHLVELHAVHFCIQAEVGGIVSNQILA
jgi:hypothetical protein